MDRISHGCFGSGPGFPPRGSFWEGTYSVPDGTGRLVNATSLGLDPETAAGVPIDTATPRPGQVVSDGIPNPPLTNLIRDTRDRGYDTLDGLGVLVNQGGHRHPALDRT